MQAMTSPIDRIERSRRDRIRRRRRYTYRFIGQPIAPEAPEA